MTQRQPPGEGNPFGWEAPGPRPRGLPTRPGGVGTSTADPDSSRSRETDTAGPSRPRRTDPPERRRQAARRRFLALAAVVTVVLAIGGVALGAVLNPFAPARPPIEAATPTTGVGASGFVSGGGLAAGQCFAAFTSAWQDEFELADCTGEHAAELYAIVPAIEFDADPTFPGEEALRAEAMRTCQAPSAMDVAAASEIEDLRIDATYALSQADWDAGVRSYWCFASRASGGSLGVPLTLT